MVTASLEHGHVFAAGFDEYRRWVLWLLLLVLCIPCGCVRRRMTIRSNPPGATVYVDDQEIGTTPVSTAYTYYGTRKIQLVRDGYETQTVLHRFAPPWYQIPPLDFVSENLSPREYRDERILDFEMEPQRVVSTAELLDRAQQLRQGTRQGYTVPPPPIPAAPMSGASSPPPFAPGPAAAPPSYPPPYYPPAN